MRDLIERILSREIRQFTADGTLYECRKPDAKLWPNVWMYKMENGNWYPIADETLEGYLRGLPEFMKEDRKS
jgi:hypothetical protein